MNEQKHIINREVLELTIPERGRAQFIQNKTSEIVRFKLNPALDNIFSKLINNEQIIRIDKLVIDLGTIAESELENVFVERAVKEISDKINGLIKSGIKTEKHTPVNGKPLEINPGVKSLTKSKDILDQFLYFLQFGHFPWWHKPSVKNAIPEANKLDDIFAEILKYDRTILKNALFPVLKKHSVQQRLLYQFNHSQLDSLLSKINDKLFESYSDLLKILLSNAGSATTINAFKISFYEIALEYFSIEKELKSGVQKIGFVKDILELVLSKIAVIEKEKILLEILYNVHLKQQIPLHAETLLILAAVVQEATELSSVSQPLKEIIKNLPDRNEPALKNLIERFILKTEQDTSEQSATEIIPDRNGDVKKGVEKLTPEREMESKAEIGAKSTSKEGRVEIGDKSISNEGRVEISDKSISNESRVEIGDKSISNESRVEIGDKSISKEGRVEITDKSISNEGRVEIGDKSISSETKVENSDKWISLFPPQPLADAEEIGVSNAGLVIIHPFLRYFFEGLNLLDKELQFKSKSDAFKAVHLLQFIVTGNETAPEIDLPLNKILCGFDVFEPVPKNVEISEEDKQECMFLINTVLERWEALKTTNPAALRETFLQREGILKQAGQAWNLTIERNTFDVMLERLPWSTSLIKLPWCEQILYVEW